MMIRRSAIGFLLCFFFCCANSNAAKAPQNSKLAAGLQAILADSRMNHVGLIVRDAKTGTVLFSKNANHLFTPASTQKLFTAIAALDYLGPDFQFHTQLLATGPVKNHSLEGDLFVKFSGDPELSTEKLDELISSLGDQGIKRIKGHVYIDNSEYGPIPYGPGWMWDDLSYGYAAPLNAVIIDHNQFILHLTPSKTQLKAPSLTPDLPKGIVQFTNHIRSTPRYEKKCPITIYSDANNHYTLDGCINQAWGKQRRTLAIRNPIAYANVIIDDALKANGIQYSGVISVASSKPNATLLAEHLSSPLRHIILTTLKESDNLATDSLLKKLGEHYYQTSGTWQNGLQAMQHILAKPTSIHFNQNALVDGAGLSRYNLITPNQFSKLLQYAYHNDSVRAPLIEALPIAGKDGTLIWRMLNFRNNRNIRAKTGSMAGVASLAGYITNRQLGTLSFTVMLNGFVGKTKPYTQLEDRLCRFLADYKPDHSRG